MAEGPVLIHVREVDAGQGSADIQRPEELFARQIATDPRVGRLRTNIGNVATLDDAVAAFNPTERISGQTIIPRSFVSDTRPSMHQRDK